MISSAQLEAKSLLSFYLLFIGIAVVLVFITTSLIIDEPWALIAFLGFPVLFLLFALRTNYKALSLILIFASYINLIKPMVGIRYAPVVIDGIIGLIFIRILLDKMLLKRKASFVSPIFETSLLLFFLISLFQLFNPNVPTLLAGLEGFRKTTYQMLAVFLGIYLVRDSSEIEKISKYMCYASVPILLYGIKQFFFFSPFDQKIVELNLGSFWTHHIAGHVRSISIFSGPFHFGMFSCFIGLLSLYFYLKRRNIFYLVLLIFSVLGVVFSMTRTNIVALIITCLFLLWFARPEKRRFFRKINIFFFLFLLIVIMVSSQKFLPVATVFKSLENISEDQRFLNRFVGYRDMSIAFVEHPIVAYGMGSAGDTLGHLFEGRKHFTSHNLGFKILIETGLVGLGIYIFFFLAWFKKAFSLFKKRDTNTRNLAVLISSIVLILLINGLVGSAVEAYPINLYIWFFMGALVKVWWLVKKQRDEKVHENTKNFTC